jgi:TonB family protein
MLKESYLIQRTSSGVIAFFLMSMVFLFSTRSVINAQEMHASNSGPEYPGGKNALKEFISKNLNYPEEAKKTGISGTIVVKFIINSEGQVDNIEIVKGISKECDAEAIRLTSLLNGWTPGIRQGNPVNTFVCLPIEFKGDKKLHPIVITGKTVERITGLPLSGIFVILKGTNIGTVTEADGSYRLEVPSDANYLECFGTGYSHKELEIDFHSTINIELEPEYQVIDFQSANN